jgi:hypothetical protein
MMITAFLLFMSMASSDVDLKSCLPREVSLTDIVTAELIKSGPEGSQVKKITVRDKLLELKARCKSGKLVDGKGREIRFYRLKGCWGNPPADYQEILAEQEKELQELRRLYTVIEMTCNPSGTPPHLISIA